MPILQSLGNASMGSGGRFLETLSPHWVSVFGETSSTYEGVQGIAIDSSGNSYVCGYGSGPSNLSSGFLAKIDQYGRKVWQKWYQAGAETYFQSMQCSGSELFLLGAVYTSGVAKRLHMKIDLNGDIIWQRLVGDGVTSNSLFHHRSLALDPFGNTVSVAGFGSAPSIYYMTTRFNTTGDNFNTYRNLTHGSNGYFDNVKMEGSTQSLYFYGDFASTGSFPEAYGLITKLNETYGQLWSIYYNNDSNRYSSTLCMSADTTNAYAAGYQGSDSGVTPYTVLAVLSKINGSNGSVAWTRALEGGLWRSVVHSPTSGNIYAVGSDYPNYNTLIAKYDTNGNLLWQRILSGVSAGYGFEIKLDSSENLYIPVGSITINGSSNACVGIVKLPGDGSLTGTYGDINYSVGSLASATPASWASTSIGVATTSSTSGNASTSAFSGTLSSYKRNIK
jgi:hypothetical protein